MQDNTRTQLGLKLNWSTLYLDEDIPEHLSIVSLINNGCKKYIKGENFAVINDIESSLFRGKEIINIAICGDTKVKLIKDVYVGDTICEYKVMKLVKKRRSCQYKKRLIALENGKVGDVVDAIFETWRR